MFLVFVQLYRKESTSVEKKERVTSLFRGEGLRLPSHPRRGSRSVQGCPLGRRGEVGVGGRSYGYLSKEGGSFSWTRRRKRSQERKAGLAPADR